MKRYTDYEFAHTPLLRPRYNKLLRQHDNLMLAKRADDNTLSSAVLEVLSTSRLQQAPYGLEFALEFVHPIAKGSTLLRNAVCLAPGAASASVRIMHSKSDAKKTPVP